MLLEEFPGFAVRNPSEFHSILSAYSSGKGQRHPLLIVATESSKSTNTSKGPMNEESVRSLGADVITFNPAAVTNLVKALKGVAEVEAAVSAKKRAKIQV